MQKEIIFPPVLFKFGKENDMEELYEKGKIYLNTFNYFRSYDCDKNRYDKNEGSSLIKQVKEIYIAIPNDNIKTIDDIKNNYVLSGNTGQFNIWEENIYGNIFCLSYYGLNKETIVRHIDTKLPLNFGKYSIIIHNPSEFINRVILEIKNQSNKYLIEDADFKIVEYYNFKNYDGKTGIFKKSDEYKWQNEFRIFLKTKYNNPILLYIGSMKDIACFVVDPEKVRLSFNTKKTHYVILKNTHIN